MLFPNISNETKNKIKAKYIYVDVFNIEYHDDSIYFDDTFFETNKYNILNIIYGTIKLDDNQESFIKKLIEDRNETKKEYFRGDDFMWVLYDDVYIYHDNSDYGGDTRVYHLDSDGYIDDIKILVEELLGREEYDIAGAICESGCDDLYDVYCDFSNDLDDIGYEFTWVNTESLPCDSHPNTFFTKSAIDNHITYNDYHYKNPKAVVRDSFRNSDIRNTVDILNVIGGQI